MRINQTLVLLVICGLFSTRLYAQSEEENIKTTLNNYLDGGTEGDTARFNRAFISQAIQRSVSKDGKIGQMTVKELASKIKPGQRLERSTRIVSWSYAGTAASAVTETDYGTSKLIDLLNLLKINGEWKIVSRVFSRIEKDEMVVSSSPIVKAPKTPSKGNIPVTTNTGGAPAKKSPAPKPKPADDGWE